MSTRTNPIAPKPGVLAVLAALTLLAACAPARVADLTQPPPPLPERALEFPAFHQSTLPNGLQLLVVEHTGQPVGNVNLYIRSGAAVEPARRAGLAGLTAELLTKGTATRTASEIAATIEGVGGQLNSNAGNDWLTVSASVLSDQLPLAFELVSDVALRPTFPEDELAVTRRRTLSGLQAQLGQPGVIAQRQFLRELYGQDHPYGVAPVPGTVQAITRDDVVGFHRSNFAPGNALLVVSGVVDRAEVEALARRHFGDWSGTAPARPDLRRPPAIDATRISLVHRPGSVQSNIRVGHLAIRPDNPDYFPLLVLNSIVGGGTDARLFQILREEKGWTYGAYSSLTRPVDIGHFAAQAEVRTEVTDSALIEMLHQLRRIRDERVPADEFEGAISFLAGSFPLRIQTSAQIAGQVAEAVLLGLPTRYVTEYRDRILAVTPADVQRVAREYVRPDRAAIVIVGDAREVLPTIEGIAPVTLYDVEGARLDRSAIEVRAATERFDGTRLRAGTASYRVLLQGNPLGTTTTSLAREGDAWVATSRTQAAVISQESRARFRVADLGAIASELEMRQGPVRLHVDLAHADGRVTGRMERPEQMGGDVDVDLAVPGGTLLPGMDEHILAVADLAEGRTLTLPVFDITGGTVTTTTYRVTGVEEVTVPAGTFSTYRVEVTSAQPMTLNVRRAAPHILVRQEYVGAPLTVELVSID